MGSVTESIVEALASLNPNVVSFGNEQDAVGDEWIRKAEERLGRCLPTSYKWFLKKYAGGEIGGEEIYSIYGLEFETVRGGDIVYQHILDVKNNPAYSSRVAVAASDFGEVFFFDYLQFADGECPVRLRLPSGEDIPYAADFYEFLYKRILAHTK
ncbi:SMI1/KNR4 family protein [Neorhizobium sp. T786]|uniref:SMI1/KNR4 family protein n=1 Tax=Pseudorhizobium xiangyangii TaxID=2883104 RepID=UPI001CFF92AE|nr:SMI1/KNR4 family protein [Neorhizobium xiangyangii]MCB5205460.1 SMI1/KNR4 family protein [Neorhizobium xiangyangii]